MATENAYCVYMASWKTKVYRTNQNLCFVFKVFSVTIIIAFQAYHSDKQPYFRAPIPYFRPTWLKNNYSIEGSFHRQRCVGVG